MQTVSIEQFESARREFDRRVERTPHVDPFCSSSYWILPAFQALFPNHDPWIRRSDQTDGWVTLAQGYHPRIGNYLQPMEASWGLASPLIGEDVEAVVQAFYRQVRLTMSDWDMLFLSGLFEETPQFESLIRQFQNEFTVGIGPSVGRNVASLEGGFEAWYGRRSSKFRSNMRRAREKAREAGASPEYIDTVEPSEADDLFERILAVERKSWKSKNRSGIATGPMRRFYGQMLPLLAEDDKLRVSFVRLDGTDIAYCFGGLFGDRYRGLQLSYDEEHAALSPGNLAQLAMLEGLCEEGIQTYDMGQAMDYKERWADEELESLALIVRK